MRLRHVFIAAGFVIFLISGWADYELQAYQHGWQPTGLVDMAHRAPHWPWYADWIPHDAWHAVQTTRNTAEKAAAGLMVLGLLLTLGLDLWTWRVTNVSRDNWWVHLLAFVGMFIAAAIARGLTFSLFYRLLN